MNKIKVVLIPGDGIGPEIVESVKKVFKAARVQIEWVEMNAGISAMENGSETPLPDELIEAIKLHGIALKAPLTTPVGTGFRSVNVAIRQALDLYANVRPIKSIEGIHSPLDSAAKIDLVIVRENTEGLYSGIEHYVGRGEEAAETIKVITKKASQRIGKYALQLAFKRGGKNRLTIVHKANIQKYTDGLFLKTIKEEFDENGFVDFLTIDDRIIDNMCAKMVEEPEKFDVIVAPNFYGDILSDLSASLIGGLGVAPGANIGDHCAVYEAVHGTAPDIAGKGIANPTALLLSAVMMLQDYRIGDFKRAKKIENAILKTIKDGKALTGDFGGTASTMEYTDEIIKNL